MEKWPDGNYVMSSGNKVLSHVLRTGKDCITRNTSARMTEKQGHRPGNERMTRKKKTGLLLFVSNHKYLLM